MFSFRFGTVKYESAIGKIHCYTLLENSLQQQFEFVFEP